MTPNNPRCEIFEPYSQQIVLLDFLKREKIDEKESKNKQNSKNKEEINSEKAHKLK